MAPVVVSLPATALTGWLAWGLLIALGGGRFSPTAFATDGSWSDAVFWLVIVMPALLLPAWWATAAAIAMLRVVDWATHARSVRELPQWLRRLVLAAFVAPVASLAVATVLLT